MTFRSPNVNVYKIPQEWKDLLHKLQECEPKTILAGGCLRDYFNRVEIKDLDFFVPYGDPNKLRNFIYKELPRWGDRDVTAEHEASAACDDTVKTVDHFGAYQIIWCKEAIEPLDRMRQFDYGACQIAYDGEHLRATEAFDHDMEYHTFTLLRATNLPQLLDSLKRWDRFRKKYPNWHLVIPPELDLPREIVEYVPHKGRVIETFDIG